MPEVTIDWFSDENVGSSGANKAEASYNQARELEGFIIDCSVASEASGDNFLCRKL